MGSTSSITAVSSYSGWQNNGVLTFTGSADVRNTTPSSGYIGASAAGNVFITNTSGTVFLISGISTSSYTSLSLSFGIYKNTTAGTGSDLIVETSTDGTTFTSLTYTALTTGSGSATWYLRTTTGTIPSTNSLTIRFRQTGSTTQYRIDDIVLKGTLICSPTKLIFSTQPSASVSQGSTIPLTVSIACASNTVITSCNSGSVTLSFNGCGLMGTIIKAVVNGVATFSDIYIDRSVQNNVKFTASYSGSCGTYTDAISNSFNVTAPLGSPNVTTIISENFNAVVWPRTIGTPSYTNVSSEGGTDVTGVLNYSGNNVMSKSYSVNNASGKQGSTNTVTFSNISGLGAYSSLTFSFQIASLGTYCASCGAGTDNGEFLKIETSLDGGSTWKTTLTNNGASDHLFPLSSASPFNIQYDANAIYSSGDALWNQSAFQINLPAGTTQFMFRMVANNNRTNEIWAIDNLVLKGTTYDINDPKQLPTATGYTINACPGASNTISVATANTVGAVTYAWIPNTNISNTSISNPIVSPTANTTYTVTITDAELCTATASVVVNIPSGSSGKWTGAVSNDWFNCLNWENGVVPDLNTDVTVTNTATNIASIDITSPYAATYSNTAMSRNLTITNQKVSFVSTSDYLKATGDLTLQTDAYLDMTNGGNIEVQGNWNNLVSTSGKGFISGLGKVLFSGGVPQSIISTNPTENFYDIEINKSSNRLNLTSSISVAHDLYLTKGIITTGNNLFTWTNSGTLRQPTDIGGSYLDSYICLCDATGTNPISFTKPFDGAKGFRINNVKNTDTWFPVGVDLVSPNRMYLFNHGSVDDITVAMEKGDIGGTAYSRVNRIWYVRQSNPSVQMYADMRLYFTQQDQSKFMNGQDEIENNFNYGDMHLIQKAYNDQTYLNVAELGDVTKFLPSPELYGKYTYGISRDVHNNKLGIDTFTRFSVVSMAQGYILPVHIVNFKAIEEGAVNELSWESMAETGLLHYEVERSFDGIHYSVIGSVNAINNGLDTKYAFADRYPADGNNFYRIKYLEKTGTTNYTYILNVKRGKGEASIAVYPNPVSSRKVVVQLNHLPQGSYELQLFNLLAQRLVNEKIEHRQGSSTETINLPAHILPGTYFVQLNTTDKRYITKLEVQ